MRIDEVEGAARLSKFNHIVITPCFWMWYLLRLPLGNLRLVNVPQLVDARSLASRNALGKLDKATYCGPPRHSILCCLSLDPNDANAGVLRASVVLAVTKITDPGLQRRGVVLLDDGTVGLDRGMA